MANEKTPDQHSNIPNRETPKRKSGVPSIRKWEDLNFEYAAFYIKLAVCKDPQLTNALIDRVVPLQKEVRSSHRKRGDYIQRGYESVLFFLQHPQFIPLMKREIRIRRTARNEGDKTLGMELENADLANHCEDKATHIYTHDPNDCGNYRSDKRYLHIYNSYAETMGRACQAAEQTIAWIARFRNNARLEAEVQAQKQEQVIKAQNQNSTSQDLLPGFIMPPAEIPDRPKRIRRSKRKFRLPDDSHTNS